MELKIKHADCGFTYLTLISSLCSLPLVGFAFCVVWSIFHHFEDATGTHCDVYNFLPSASAAIGGNAPEKYIWRMAIALHIAPRFFFPYLDMRWHLQYTPKTNRLIYVNLTKVVCVMHALELVGLTGLSYISSDENEYLHAIMFAVFISSSGLYMLLSILLRRWAQTHCVLSGKELFSYHVKKYTFAIFLLSFVLAMYFYWRHHAYCEPYVYSMFALMEYLVIITNIGFHWTGGLDYSDKYFGTVTFFLMEPTTFYPV